MLQVLMTYQVLARPRFARTLNQMTTKAARAIRLKDYLSLTSVRSGEDVSTPR
jgi:hypothetical protein